MSITAGRYYARQVEYSRKFELRVRFERKADIRIFSTIDTGL